MQSHYLDDCEVVVVLAMHKLLTTVAKDDPKCSQDPDAVNAGQAVGSCTNGEQRLPVGLDGEAAERADPALSILGNLFPLPSLV